LTDTESLYQYRMKQAEETLREAERMMAGGFSSRTIINRAYYAIFYSLLSLFLNEGVILKTSKHMGVISHFDKEFILTKKIDSRYSAILHKVFNARQKVDYQEFADASLTETRVYVDQAREFIDRIGQFCASR
jgi:uncharacterized protein (UPF0332 family)